MIEIDKIFHRERYHILLRFKYDTNVIVRIKTISSARYSRTYKAWYIGYDKTSYGALKLLGYKITISKKSGTTSQSAPAGIESTSHAVPSHRPKDRDADILKKSKEIVLNNQVFRLKIPYTSEDVRFVKNLERSYWNADYGVWVIKASVCNLRALQDYFRFWDAASYEQQYEIISLTEDPQKLELYTTPEYKDKVAVKLSGYRIDVEFMKHIPERSYCKQFKRWLLPNEAVLINRIIAHYSEKNTKIINRLPKGEKHYLKIKRSLGERQKYLICKFGKTYQPLLKTYTDVLIAERYSWRTITSYTAAIFNYSKAIGIENLPSSNEITARNYISSISAQKVSDSRINLIFSAIKLYYEKVIFRPDFDFKKLNRPRKGRYLPTILSVQEVERILKSLSNLKHTTLLYTLYSSGMRLSEVLSVRVNDILWDRNQVFIKAGKGKKDRMVMLSNTLKEVLKFYIDQYQPEYWLFEGQNRQHQYSARSVQNIVKQATKKAGISKRVTPHTLRHCFATHLMDNNTGVRYIQELLGHKDIKTTLIYTHVTTAKITSIESPLDKMGINFTS